MADDQANLHGCVDGSGSVVVTGQSYRDANTTDFGTLAYSSTGVPLWANRYNGHANGDDTNIPVSNGWSLAADTRAANNRDISVAIPATKSGRFFRLESQ